jgi:RNA polymerase sigma-70 factor (ECF subfamily)
MGRHLHLISDGTNGTHELVIAAPDPRPGPERTVASIEMLDRVEGALSGLAENHRVALWLRDGEGLSYEEIARVLDLPIGTVRSRLARARMALRKAVES